MGRQDVEGTYCFVLAASLQLQGATFDVKTFGAKADGKTGDRCTR